MWIDHWREILNLNLYAFNKKLQAHITDLKGKRFIPTLNTMSSPHILPADKVVVWFTSLSMNKANETFTLMFWRDIHFNVLKGGGMRGGLHSSQVKIWILFELVGIHVNLVQAST